jgi:hypothetical protein
MPLRHSMSSSSRRRSPTAPLPARLQLLEQLTLSLAASRSHKRDVRYELTVSHAASGVSWRLRRSFEEYHTLQQRLLVAMQHGHFCQADCPYLFSFVKSYFPKPALFGGNSACAVDKRRDALAQCLTTLQKFVVNRANLTCQVVSGAVADEVLAFILGDVSSPKHPLHEVVLQQQAQQLKQLQSGDSSAFTSSSRSSCLSFVSSTSDESDEVAELDACACSCAICHSSLDGEAFADSKAAGPEDESDRHSSSSSRGSSSSLASRCSSLSYTTTLSCGHVFHDECIVPKLNEDMVCPTCGAAVAP